MTKDLAITDRERINHLAEEIQSIISVSKDSVTIQLIAAKYEIGKAIVTNELYSKYSKDQGELYEEIEKIVRIKHTTLAECAKLYETYPKKKSKAVAEKLYTRLGAWRNIRAELYGDVSAAAKTTERLGCKNCPIHCP